MSKGYWWCPNCQMELEGYNVTYEKTCSYCGSNVEWIEKCKSEADIEEAVRYMQKAGTKVERLQNGKYKIINCFGVSLVLTTEKFLEFVQEYKRTEERANNEDYCCYNNELPHWSYYLNNPIDDE